MTIFRFIKYVTFSRPMTIGLVLFFSLLAGILELFSLAMVLPVLMNLLDSEQATGLAGKFIALTGFSDIPLTQALMFIALFMSIRGLLMLCADFIIVKVARDLEVDVRSNIFANLVNARWDYIQTQDLGKLPNLILRETEKYAVAIQKLGQFLSSALIAGILILSSLFASWQLAVLFVVAVLPYFIFVRFLNKRISGHAQERIVAANQLSAQISENLMHMKYIKSSSLETYTSERFHRSIKTYAHHFFRVICYARFIKNFPEIFGVLIIAVLVFYAHSSMGMESADIIFFLLLMFRGYRQISGIQTMLSSLVENIPSYQTCQNFLEDCAKNKEQEQEKKQPPPSPDSVHIETQNVTYTYPSRENPALKAINITLPKTGLIAFIGESGAGKTTLIDLILGLMPPQDGTIRIKENQTLSESNIKLWRENIGYVPQDPFLITGSLKDNILLHAQDQTDEHLVHIGKLTQIHDFVQNLPDGYETPIGLINTGLSGGQKQRIAIARALAKDPAFLILDEATSALDPKTEREIKDVIIEISKSKLVLMIAHSNEMIKDADTIYLMHNAELAAAGHYKDLLKNSDVFQTYISKTN